MMKRRGYGSLVDKMNKRCDEFLDAVDDYLEAAADDLWWETSVFTGNTRGALKVIGKYPETTDVVFDKQWWFKPKTLVNLKPKTVHAEWNTKKFGKRSKTYVYGPGRIRVKITGEDYAPRIPMPPHGGGNVDMLIATYEELKKIEFDKQLKMRGF